MRRSSTSGEVTNALGELFGVGSLLHERDGEDVGVAGGTEILTHLGDERVELLDIDANLLLAALVDGFLILRVGGGRGAVHAVGEVGIGGMGGGERLGGVALSGSEA